MWYKTSEHLPPEGMIVQTKIDDERGIRNVYILKRIDWYWVFPDDGVWVWYTPTHWRYL